MVTLPALVDAEPNLHVVVDGNTGPVVGVWPIHDKQPPHGWRHMLVLANDAEECVTAEGFNNTVSLFAHAGAAGIVVKEPVPPALVDAARRLRLTLVAAKVPISLPRLAQTVSDLRHNEEADRAESLGRLLRLAQNLSSELSTCDELVNWVARAIQGHAVLLEPCDEDDVVLGDVRLPAGTTRELVLGARRSASLDEGDWSVRLYAIGPKLPHPVLAVARRGSWPPEASAPVGQVAMLLSGWISVLSSSSEAVEGVHASVLQLLMKGHVSAARRVAVALSSGHTVMAGEDPRVRVYLLDGAPGYRPAMIAKCRRQLGTALVSPCPVDPRQIIIVSDADDRRERTLKDLLIRHTGYCIGASRSTILSAVGEAHGQATRALATSATSPDRFAIFTPEVELVRVLPFEPAHRWAADLLAPLEGWDQDRRDREDWLATAAMWLSFGTSGTAGLVEMHRNTIDRRVASIGRTLGLDLTQLLDRVRLDLALRINALHGSSSPEPGPVPRLKTLLTDPAVVRWAHDYLNQLEPELRDTLRAWIFSGLRTGPTAAYLKVRQKTVRARLHRAAGQLQQPLIPQPDQTTAQRGNGLHGAHDVVLAFYIAGEMVHDFALDEPTTFDELLSADPGWADDSA